MPAAAFKSATLVFGMHRSGTSALAGALRLCGLTVPNTLVPPNDANLRGFWESQPIKSFNDDLLGSLGLSWHSLEAREPETLERAMGEQTRKLASAILREEFPPDSHIVIKDPRLCRLLPLWRPIVQEASARVASMIIIRSPAQVARSLYRRNEIDLHHGMLLWLRYLLDAELDTRGSNRSFTSYTSLVGGPAEAVRSLGIALNLPINPDAAALSAIREYLTADLRAEHPFEQEPLSREMPVVAEAYRIFDRWSHGGNESEEDYQELDRNRNELDRMSAAIANMAENARLDRKRTAAARAQTQEVSVGLARAQESLERLKEIRAQLEQQGESLESLLENVAGASPEHVRLVLEKEFSELDNKVRSRIAKFAHDVAGLGEFQRSGFAALESSVKDIATNLVALTEGNGATLEGVEAGIASILGAEQEQSAFLSRISMLLDERQTLEQALAESLRAGADAAARLESAEAILAKAAEDHAQNRAALIAEQQESAERHARDREQLVTEYNAFVSSQEQLLDQARERIEALEKELDRTKRKYRGAQFDAERERKAHAAARTSLATAEAKVREYESSIGSRTSLALTQWSRRALEFAKQARTPLRKRRKANLQTILDSGLFDRDWYLARYPDVANDGVDPLVHFSELGWREGRDPGPNFATSTYLKANADVARAGINPLVHFIEFGRSEGREFRVGRSFVQAPAPIVHDFPEPAPIFRGNVQENSPVRWLRSHQLSSDDRRLLSNGDIAIGYIADGTPRIEAAFDRLARLSGLDSATVGRAGVCPDYTSAKLIDAWYVNQAQLRTRWKDDELPFVVRVLQHDPMVDGQLKLIGEGLTSSELDFVDVSLSNPYFPILFVFGEPDGTLRGARLMAFPSLCRGGLHYPELLAISPESPDPLEAGLAEATRIEKMRSAKARLVQSIRIDLSGSDGTSPLFRLSFQTWLDRVAGVTVNALDQEDRPQEAGLDGLGNVLILAADMVPTIRVLSETEGADDTSAQPKFLPLLIAGTEPSQPATLVELPFTSPPLMGNGSSYFPSPWPRLVGPRAKLPEAVGPAAIRIPSGRGLTDSEIAIPVMSAAPSVSAEIPPITWLIGAGEWRTKDLIESLTALSLQTGADSQSVAFIGEANPDAFATAKRLLGNRVRSFPDFALAAKESDTPLIGYLGPGVVLHNSRTAAELTRLLSDPGVTSAACPLAVVEKRGKNWHWSVFDAGMVIDGQQSLRPLAGPGGAQTLWRSSFPVSIPPRDLWIARATSVRLWLRHRRRLRLREGMHVCTSLVSASYVATPDEKLEVIPIPAAPEDRATRMKVLFG